MRINQNIAAFNAYRNLSQTQNKMSGSLEKLSSGFRINRAADDAAGLVNSENLRAQVGGLKIASRNAQDAISLVQTAEGAQTEVHSILQRMRDLAVQSASAGTNDEASLEANQAEIDELKAELNRIAGQTQYGTKTILGGEFETADDTVTGDYAEGDWFQRAGVWQQADDSTAREEGDVTQSETSRDFTFQVGANSGQTASVNVSAVFAHNLGTTDFDGTDVTVASIDVTTEAGAAQALDVLDAAISEVSETRANLGAFQNRMESTIRNVSVAIENLSAAESRIRDVDMAEEMVSFTRHQILQQAGTAMLAQANAVPQNVLALLR